MMKRKKVKFYVAFDATWDILTIHDTYRDSFCSMQSLSMFIPDRLVILKKRKDGVLIPVRDHFWFYPNRSNSSFLDNEED